MAPMAVALALGYRLALNPYLHDASPFMYFFVAIIVSGWLGGLGPALTATGLSMLAVDYFYLPPIGSVLRGGPEQIIQTISFLALGAAVSAIVERLRRERQRAEQAAGEAQASETEARIAEGRLKDTERRLTVIIEFLPDATFALDNAGRIIAWNKAMEDLTGAPAVEVLGKGNHEHTYRLYGKRIPCLADTVLRGDEVEWSFSNLIRENDIVKAETYIPHLKPGGVWLSIKVAPIYDALGNITGVIDSCRDITERKRAEGVLRESEERYRSLFENMVEGYAYCRMLFDGEGHPRDFVYLQVNDVFRRLTGMEGVEGVEGRRVTEVFPGIRESYPELFEIYGRVSTTGRPERFEIEFKPMGRWLSISVYSPAQGAFVAVFDDISERKRSEETILCINQDLAARNAELNTERQRWQGVVEGIADEVWICDTQGKMSLMNLASVTAMNLKAFKDKTVDEVLDEVEILNPDGRLRPPEQAPLLRSLRGEIVRGEEIMIHRQTGKRRWRQFSSAPTRDAAGAITGAVAIARDITNLRNAEEGLRVANERLLEADRRKDEFMAMLAHELRNPLAPIRYAVQMLNMNALPEKQIKKQHEVIDRQVSHMGRLLDDLLDVSRITRGKIHAQAGNCGPADHRHPSPR